MYLQMYTILNYYVNNMQKYLLTNDRNMVMIAQNKFPTFNTEQLPTRFTRKLFEHQMRSEYNKLNKGITLNPDIETFNKWIKT